MSADADRIETDTLGAVSVPGHALWGAQTERSRHCFAIGTERMPLPLIHAIAEIKRAAAVVNGGLGRLPADKAAAIAAAAARVAQGEFDAEFPLSVWQTGSGTQSHMNVNEVVAHLASRTLGAPGGAHTVHPNDDVNQGQSSNDVVPTAMHLAALRLAAPLLDALADLQSSLLAKAREFGPLVKVGRTHLQDATPLLLAQEFGAYAAQLALCERGIRQALPAVEALAIGGTAVGTGMGTHPAFGERMVAALSAQCGLPLKQAGDLFAAMAGHEPLVALHGALRTLAVALLKIGGDIRLMGSGPRAGLGELRLPANEPGSSIMPGKVNPTQVEALGMVCLQVMGHDVALGMAASQGHFELNATKPLIALNLLGSLRALGDAMRSFDRYCVQGLAADPVRIAELLGRSLMGVTALAPHIGYERAAAIARHAHAEGSTLREAALSIGGLSESDYERWMQPTALLGPL